MCRAAYQSPESSEGIMKSKETKWNFSLLKYLVVVFEVSASVYVVHTAIVVGCIDCICIGIADTRVAFSLLQACRYQVFEVSPMNLSWCGGPHPTLQR